MKYPLPYAYAREHGLLLEQDDDVLVLHWGDAASDAARWSAFSEVMRQYQPRELQQHPVSTLAQRISSVYADQTSGGGAAAVVSEVQSDVDLSRMMQDLPAVEDLLESADDAPIIRMLNALLSQAARDGASTSNPTSATPACAFASMVVCAMSCSPIAPSMRP